MTTRVFSLDELRQDLDGVLESFCESGRTVVVELPNQRRVTIQNWDADDDFVDRLLEGNSEFRDMAQKSFSGPRRLFPFSTPQTSP